MARERLEADHDMLPGQDVALFIAPRVFHCGLTFVFIGHFSGARPYVRPSGVASMVMTRKRAHPEGLWQTTGAWLLTLQWWRRDSDPATARCSDACACVWHQEEPHLWRDHAGMNDELVATSFGLYYMAGETVRPWMGNVHIVAGSTSSC